MAGGVDLALVIALDASASVTFEEFNLIAGGMAEAFRDPLVARGLTAGPAGASLVSLLLWSGRGAQAVPIGWTRIASAADAAGFADALDNMPRGVRAGATAIGEALLAAITLLAHLPEPSARQVVNVVGDGRSNDGLAPGPVRDRMAAAGITINGLCILHEEPDLLDSYANEVIGGPGAFAVLCPDYAAFAEAMRRKLLRELNQPTV
jgi:Ca-activated chloride channel family protein